MTCVERGCLTGDPLHPPVQYKVAPDEVQERLDSSDMLVFAIDEGGRVSEWNSVMEKITGLARDQVMNKKLVGEVMSTNPQLFMTDKVRLHPCPRFPGSSAAEGGAEGLGWGWGDSRCTSSSSSRRSVRP